MDKKLIAMIGGVVLIAGLFLPIVNSGGTSASFMSTAGGGIAWESLVMIGCGALAVILALIGQAKHVVWFGIVALGMTVWKFLETKNAIDAAGAAVPAGMELPPELASQMPTMNMLGWAVLGVGGLIMLIGGAMAWKDGASAPPPAAV